MLYVQVGFGCNNACVFCAQGELRTTSTDPGLDALAASLAALPSGEPVAFVGGEPTLLPALSDLARRAREHGATRVLVQTNGRRLSESGLAGELLKAGVSSLDVSLHGSSEPMHDWHTGVAGSFRQTITGLRRARAAGLPFATTTVVTRSNFRHLVEIVRVAHVLGARAVQLVAARLLGQAARNAARVIPAPQLAEREIARAFDVARSLELEVVAGHRVEPASAAAWFAGLGSVEPDDRNRQQAVRRERPGTGLVPLRRTAGAGGQILTASEG